MATKSCAIRLPLGISRARNEADIQQLREVFGVFEFIDFNLAHIGHLTFSLRITRSGVPNTMNGVMTIDEPIGGVLGDTIRLTYGEHVVFQEFEDSVVTVLFSSSRK